MLVHFKMYYEQNPCLPPEVVILPQTCVPSPRPTSPGTQPTP